MQSQELMFSTEEKIEFLHSYLELRRQTRSIINESEFEKLRHIISEATAKDQYGRDRNGNSILLRNFNTALILSKEVGLDRSTLLSILLYNVVAHKSRTIEYIEKEFGGDVAGIISHLIKTESLYSKHATVQSDNFRKLLLSFANDARVIIILIADNLCLMRMINHHPDNNYRLV